MSDEVTLKDEYDLVGGGHVCYYQVDAWSFEVNSNGDDDTDLEEITEAIDAWYSWHEYVLDNNLHIKDKKEAPTMDIPPSDPARPQSLDYNQGVADALDEVEAAMKHYSDLGPDDIDQLRVRYGIIPDKKDAPPVEPSTMDRTDAPEFTPPGEGWIEGPVPPGAPGRYELIRRWVWSPGAGTPAEEKTYHRRIPEPPIELPTEDGAVSEVKWKTGRFSSTLLLREGRWFTVPHGAVSYTPEELVDKIESFEVISRPVASVAKDVLAELRSNVGAGGFIAAQTVNAVAKKWGVK